MTDTARSFPFGVDEEWSDTNEGDNFIYTANPADVPPEVAARVIYELRLDVGRLNGEAMDNLARARAAENELATLRTALRDLTDVANLPVT